VAIRGGRGGALAGVFTFHQRAWWQPCRSWIDDAHISRTENFSLTHAVLWGYMFYMLWEGSHIGLQIVDSQKCCYSHFAHQGVKRLKTLLRQKQCGFEVCKVLTPLVSCAWLYMRRKKKIQERRWWNPSFSWFFFFFDSHIL